MEHIIKRLVNLILMKSDVKQVKDNMTETTDKQDDFSIKLDYMEGSI